MKYIISLLLVLSSPVSVFGQNRTFRVSVVVGGEKRLEAEVISFITRELRSLKDVVITDDKPQWTLSFVVQSLGTSTVKRGYALSYVMRENLSDDIMDIYHVSQELRTNLRPYSLQMEHSLFTGPPENLVASCQQIVAQLDTDTFKYFRELWQKRDDVDKLTKAKQKLQ